MSDEEDELWRLFARACCECGRVNPVHVEELALWTCPRCELESALRQLSTLAANLATAAALCRAHQLGYANGWFTSKLGRDAGWKPGCEREQAVEI